MALPPRGVDPVEGAWKPEPVANESRLELVEGRRRHALATCVSGVPLAWSAMFRSADLVSSRTVRFTTSWESAAGRLDDPQHLRHMFAAYGDVAEYTRLLSRTFAAQAATRGRTRVSVDVGEIAGEHPDPLAWARALAKALDALDGPTPTPAPAVRPEAVEPEMTEIDKIRRLRLAGDLGIGEARSRLREHDGDLAAALAAVEAAKSHDERARDRAGVFLASLADARPSVPSPPWQVLLAASGLELGTPFPPADLLLRPSAAPDRDIRIHARLLGEGVVPGTASWEPDGPT